MKNWILIFIFFSFSSAKAQDKDLTPAFLRTALWGSMASVLYFLPATPYPRVRGGFLFDDPVRNALRWGSEAGRSAFSAASYVTLGASISLSLLTFSNSKEFLSVVETYGLTTFTTFLFQKGIARARPCSDSPTCQEPSESFFSGHTSIAFTAAGITCRKGGTLCPVTLGLASFTGLLRIISDRHYFSDVLVGAAVGFVSAYFIPDLWEKNVTFHVLPKENGALVYLRYTY